MKEPGSVPEDDPRLEYFRSMNNEPKKRSWQERAREVGVQFPSLPEFDWRAAFDEEELLWAMMIRDIMKLDQAAPGKAGPRKGVDYATGVKRLKVLFGQDFCTLPFIDAFGLLIGDRSISAVAHKIGLERSTTYRLLKGMKAPDAYEMEQIARSYGKHPSWFCEWRHAYITAAIIDRLETVPEAGISYYRQLVYGVRAA